MSYVIMTVCLIVAQVSSRGDTINVNHLRYLEQTERHCVIRQYYNPHIIYSDWTCEQVEESIIDAIKLGCNNS